MVKFDGIKGQELLDVEEGVNELTLIFKDNRYLFIKMEVLFSEDKGQLCQIVK